MEEEKGQTNQVNKSDKKTLKKITAVMAFFKKNVEYYNMVLGSQEFREWNAKYARTNEITVNYKKKKITAKITDQEFYKKGEELNKTHPVEQGELTELIRELSTHFPASKAEKNKPTFEVGKGWGEIISAVSFNPKAEKKIQEFLSKNPDFLSYFYEHRESLTAYQNQVKNTFDREFQKYLLKKNTLTFLQKYKNTLNKIQNKPLSDLVQKIINGMEGRSVLFSSAEKAMLGSSLPLLFRLFVLLKKPSNIGMFPQDLREVLNSTMANYSNTIEKICNDMRNSLGEKMRKIKNKNKRTKNERNRVKVHKGYEEKANLFLSAIRTYDESAEFSREDIYLIKDLLPSNILEYVHLFPKKISEVLKTVLNAPLLDINISHSAVEKAIQESIIPGHPDYMALVNKYVECNQNEEGTYQIEKPLKFKSNILDELSRGNSYKLNGRSFLEILEHTDDDQDQSTNQKNKRLLKAFHDCQVTNEEQIVAVILAMAQIDLEQGAEQHKEVKSGNLTHLGLKLQVDPEAGQKDSNIEIKDKTIFLSTTTKGKLREGDCFSVSEKPSPNQLCEMTHRFKIEKSPAGKTEILPYEHYLVLPLQDNDELFRVIKTAEELVGDDGSIKLTYDKGNKTHQKVVEGFLKKKDIVSKLLYSKALTSFEKATVKHITAPYMDQDLIGDSFPKYLDRVFSRRNRSAVNSNETYAEIARRNTQPAGIDKIGRMFKGFPFPLDEEFKISINKDLLKIFELSDITELENSEPEDLQEKFKRDFQKIHSKITLRAFRVLIDPQTNELKPAVVAVLRRHLPAYDTWLEKFGKEQLALAIFNAYLTDMMPDFSEIFMPLPNIKYTISSPILSGLRKETETAKLSLKDLKEKCTCDLLTTIPSFEAAKQPSKLLPQEGYTRFLSLQTMIDEVKSDPLSYEKHKKTYEYYKRQTEKGNSSFRAVLLPAFCLAVNATDENGKRDAFSEGIIKGIINDATASLNIIDRNFGTSADKRSVAREVIRNTPWRVLEKLVNEMSDEKQIKKVTQLALSKDEISMKVEPTGNFQKAIVSIAVKQKNIFSRFKNWLLNTTTYKASENAQHLNERNKDKDDWKLLNSLTLVTQKFKENPPIANSASGVGKNQPLNAVENSQVSQLTVNLESTDIKQDIIEEAQKELEKLRNSVDPSTKDISSVAPVRPAVGVKMN